DGLDGLDLPANLDDVGMGAAHDFDGAGRVRGAARQQLPPAGQERHGHHHHGDPPHARACEHRHHLGLLEATAAGVVAGMSTQAVRSGSNCGCASSIATSAVNDRTVCDRRLALAIGVTASITPSKTRSGNPSRPTFTRCPASTRPASAWFTRARTRILDVSTMSTMGVPGLTSSPLATSMNDPL